MYSIRQFRPTLYVLLAIGLVGFCIAAQMPLLGLIAIAGLLLNAWLVNTGRFIPLPAVAAACATILSLLYVALEIRAHQVAPIINIGEFLVLLHLVKLYEQRTNRDYAQLLVISLLLMAAAAISTASLIFGVLLMIYLLISLYCALLFQLKMETDAVIARIGPRTEQVNPATLRQDQRRLSSSMRRLTGLVAVVSLGVAVFVFIFWPRVNTDNWLSRRFLMAPTVLSEFNDEVSLDQVARINQSDELVAQVRVTVNGQPWGGTAPLLLRGTTLEDYSPGDSPTPWTWRRVAGLTDPHDTKFTASGGLPYRFDGPLDTENLYQQEVTLQPSFTKFVFAMAGPSWILPDETFEGQYFHRDGVLISNQPLDQGGTLRYTIWSTGRPNNADSVPPFTAPANISPKIQAYARRPEVSGADSTGHPLSQLLGMPQAPPDINRRIAQAMVAHLRSQFTYTLDLTNARDIIAGQDPLVAFLYDLKRGHCEYFAGAMTLMCQSIGVPARMVVGYRSDEFNPVGSFYNVRKNQAHAWVEVLTDQGWETFDPTSGNQTMEAASTGILARIRSLFNYLEYRWATSVVAYGQENRQAIMSTMDVFTVNAAGSSIDKMHALPRAWTRFLDRIADYFANPTWVTTLTSLLLTAMAAVICYFIYEQSRLRRRAQRIGLDRLPPEQRRRLTRQLGFYDDLLRLLERRGIIPPPHLTPLEFSDQLNYLPNQTFHDIRRLTRLFYRIRFGGAELNNYRKKVLSEAIARIDGAFNKARRHEGT
jgi:hypothetical protein